MSDENKPEEFAFDVTSPASGDDANDVFDFGFPTEDVSVPSTDAFPKTPDGGAAFGSFGESSVPVESEFPAVPSGFLTENAESIPEPEAAASVIESPKKKGKKDKEKPEKKKKEKKEKVAGDPSPMSLGGVLSLGFGILALLGLGTVNALIFTAPATPGIGGSSTMYYVVGVNVFGLAFVAVPFLFWMFYKGKKEEQDLQLFDVLLGVALMAFVVGVLCLLTALYRYDFTFKAAVTPTHVRSVG